ncbi:MAG: class I SAM-dependent methyltransferase family protein [Candidatus Thorarchaeota archaeon]|jgi:tRNA wybutosine-synthesizing protein 2
MQYLEFLKIRLQGVVPESTRLPSGFHLIGHVAILNLNRSCVSFSEQIGHVTLEYDRRIKSVAFKTGPTEGCFRKPDYTLIAGDSNTLTTHIEAGVSFRVDPLRFTFSGGNRAERIRMGKIVEPGERILDMFACVGQFSLHAAAKPGTEVIAIEINPEAYRLLVENISLNKLNDRMIAILGDCRDVHPKGSMNRVIMGCLHDTQNYLIHALDALVSEGGIVHMHIALPENKLLETTETVGEICSSHGFTSQVSIRRVKIYAPNIYHNVFDILVE